ncbi:hypothetical protein ACTXT7_008868 [Hymenolepis weldensis]
MNVIAVTALFCIFLHKTYGFGPAVEFDLPKNSNNAYVGQLFKHESSVKFSPRLRAFTNPEISRSNKICGFRPIVNEDYQFPFEVYLKDANLGTGEVRVRNDAPVDFTYDRMYTFQIEAYDCDSPPNHSQSVLVNINIRAEEELRFTDAIYNFPIPMYSSIGSICGKVTVMHESSSPSIEDKTRQCGYSLVSSAMVPFTIDSHGKPKIVKIVHVQIIMINFRERLESMTAEKSINNPSQLDIELIMKHLTTATTVSKVEHKELRRPTCIE